MAPVGIGCFGGKVEAGSGEVLPDYPLTGWGPGSRISTNTALRLSADTGNAWITTT